MSLRAEVADYPYYSKTFEKEAVWNQWQQVSDAMTSSGYTWLD